MQLDLKSIAANVIKNNMGVGGIRLQARAAVEGASARLAETGQTLPVKNGPARSGKPWQVFDVEGWGEGENTALVWQAEHDAPAADR